MLRTLVYLFLAILLITIIRAVIGLIGKAFAQLFQPDTPARPSGPKQTPSGGELKQDPVCGIYVSDETRLKKTVNGQTYYFCSEACRDKFQG